VTRKPEYPPEWDEPEPPEVELMSIEELWGLVDFLEYEGYGDDNVCREALAELGKRGV